MPHLVGRISCLTVVVISCIRLFSGSAAGGREGSEEKMDHGIVDGGGPGEREEERLFPREVSAWQLQWRLQRKVLRLEDGLSSQLPFEEIEGEVQVRREYWRE